ncbi:hypothetical protein RhiirA1_468931 [Rhizophagus irregularis]|uniref:Uncharacterized protein n=1 Tax=Rhizophagus irregularis TaxID=588596 RepID=A0A2I1EH26_9GLOM|nr:hypothetical protein RhiirA1_468931 [Rhizophagus irregularis]PKY21427.1 hypothetical protein RhiirB3_435029 [Rhizophagus irregularis]
MVIQRDEKIVKLEEEICQLPKANLAKIAKEILIKHMDKLSLYITDSIEYSSIFKWMFKDLSISVEALLLLHSYISEDLYQSFRFILTPL